CKSLANEPESMYGMPQRSRAPATWTVMLSAEIISIFQNVPAARGALPRFSTAPLQWCLGTGCESRPALLHRRIQTIPPPRGASLPETCAWLRQRAREKVRAEVWQSRLRCGNLIGLQQRFVRSSLFPKIDDPFV